MKLTHVELITTYTNDAGREIKATVSMSPSHGWTQSGDTDGMDRPDVPQYFGVGSGMKPRYLYYVVAQDLELGETVAAEFCSRRQADIRARSMRSAGKRHNGIGPLQRRYMPVLVWRERVSAP